ncbi:hypothetical protein EDD21DRAFT_231355 [Dissophora ornata]|nr:hypothetical protein EDD21DRAFT_231355 [Dissophora ornata]
MQFKFGIALLFCLVMTAASQANIYINRRTQGSRVRALTVSDTCDGDACYVECYNDGYAGGGGCKPDADNGGIIRCFCNN